MREITKDVLLYTEMVVAPAILHGDRGRLLGFSEVEHPVALQIGGDDPADLARCAVLAEDLGYDEVNLNVGCPSDRVQAGRFGAVLMRTPAVVAEAVAAMVAVVDIEVTVKHRIGVDELDQMADLLNFVQVVAQAGCRRFTVHARKAWLQGLSPKQNRSVPPLRYQDVYALKRELPELCVEINGGVTALDQVAQHLEHVDAVMIGRAAYDVPWIFADADRQFYGRDREPLDRFGVAEAMIPYIERQNALGQPTHRVTRHMLNLFSGQPGTRRYKRALTELGGAPGGEAVMAALASVRSARADKGRPGQQ